MATAYRSDLPLDQSMRSDRHRWPHETDWTLECGPDDAPCSVELTVPYSYRFGTGPSWTSYGGDPGDPAELETGTPFFLDGNTLIEVNLTDAERDRVETWIHENPPEPDYPEDW